MHSTLQIKSKIHASFLTQALAGRTDNESGADTGKVSMNKLITALTLALAMTSCISSPIKRHPG
ncbi:hypothetical protein CJ672_11205, partial [Arcobacter cryaerophilus gv. occultus]